MIMTRSLCACCALPAKFSHLWNLLPTLKGHRYSKLLAQVEDGKSKEVQSGSGQGEVTGRGRSSYWVPHARTGIYFPQGHEQVMKDIPNGAATTLSGHDTYWLRSVEGVDKAYPETPAD